MNLTNPAQLVAFIIAIMVVFGTILCVIVRAFTTKAINKIENAVTRSELKDALADVVRKDAMNLALALLNKEISMEVGKTRHDLRGEMNILIVALTNKMEMQHTQLCNVQQSVAGMEASLKSLAAGMNSANHDSH